MEPLILLYFGEGATSVGCTGDRNSWPEMEIINEMGTTCCP